MREQTSNVAVYWDFENIQASLVEKKGGPGAYGRTKYLAQEQLIDIDSVMEFAATFGVVSINRAYCNWQWYGKYRGALLHNGLELIQLFHPGASAKNGGDIKLCLDCTEDLMRFPHIDVVVIVGGDSDYLPVAQKIKAMGKTLVGIGVEANTNRHWAHSCHEFRFYESLILDDNPEVVQVPAVPQPAPAADTAVATKDLAADSTEIEHNQSATEPELTPHSVDSSAPQVAVSVNDASDHLVKARPEDLLRRAILRLAGKSGDSWVLKGAIRPMLKRLDPTFEEIQHGARNFSAFIRKFDHILEVRAGRNDQEVRLRSPEDIRPAPPEGGTERTVEGLGRRHLRNLERIEANGDRPGNRRERFRERNQNRRLERNGQLPNGDDQNPDLASPNPESKLALQGRSFVANFSLTDSVDVPSIDHPMPLIFTVDEKAPQPTSAILADLDSVALDTTESTPSPDAPASATTPEAPESSAPALPPVSVPEPVAAPESSALAPTESPEPPSLEQSAALVAPPEAAAPKARRATSTRAPKPKANDAKATGSKEPKATKATKAPAVRKARAGKKGEQE